MPNSVESRNLKQGRHPVNVGYIGAKQTLETAMDDEVANAGKTSRANFPWLAAYPPGVPARIETPPYSLLGEIAPDWAVRKPAARAFTTIMPNGMAASLSFAASRSRFGRLRRLFARNAAPGAGSQGRDPDSKWARLSGRRIRHFQGWLRARQCQSALYGA